MESLKFNPDDYVEITSYNHIPFYKASYLAIPDNYDFASYYNLPIGRVNADRSCTEKWLSCLLGW